MSDELREKVAEMFAGRHFKHFLLDADAAIALVRDATLEEAAVRLDREWPGPASAIVRAMKGKP